ncbi:histidinol-phosphate transaminase [Leucobacter chromiireducens]|uniref:Aromatic amino acid aminotransferase n=1 Tax=Leucobacter chromiireducens subsp. chromiireducens TaxID=660067 RepID=A0ABS1SN72_9MICO|nr:histidinol-phosphate transaminase [Leucobacter chromiireducens]MBL3688356.1 histidinol-phosphate transaminase [Leucobacter chromiireducens subsp. chromiireducens]
MSKVTQFRPGLEKVAAYRAGKPAPVGPDGRSVKLSSNENPYAPLPSVVRRLAEALPESISRYPSIAAEPLTAALATRFGVAADNLALGSGSVEVAAQLIHALAGPGDEVMFAWRSFEAYPILVRVAGAVPVEVPLDADARHDLSAMADAITDRTRLIFVCNPNNPTGTVVTEAELEAFMARVPSDVLVVVDEAYVHFDVAADSPSGIDFFRRYDNVAVLHTFSKAYGLAGLRVGYAIAPDAVAEALRKVAIPFAVTRLAQEAAVASLEAEGELQVRIDEMVLERDRLTAALREAGVTVVPSQANFVWLPLGEDTMAAAEGLERHGISARAFAGEGVRISIGDPAENDLVIAAVRAEGIGSAAK